MSPAATGARSRSYYYLASDGALARHVVPYRDGRHYRIPKALDPRNLIVVLDYDGDRTRVVERGPKHDARFEQLAVLREFGVEPSTSPDVGTTIPQEVVTAAVRMIGECGRNASRSIHSLWNNLGGETDMVALLVDRLNSSLEVDGWAITIRPQVFSSQAKEPQVGADLAWIVQIRTGPSHSNRTTKALWMQAKKTVYDINTPGDIFELKDFKKQFATMKLRTTEAFGVVFTPDRIVVGDETHLLSLEDIFRQTITCIRGDQREQILAESVDRHYLVVATFDRKRRRPRSRTTR